MTPTGSARFASVAANRGRGGRDFSLRELAVLEFLKPHLARALCQAELFGQARLCQELPPALGEYALRPAL